MANFYDRYYIDIQNRKSVLFLLPDKTEFYARPARMMWRVTRLDIELDTYLLDFDEFSEGDVLFILRELDNEFFEEQS